MRRIWLATFLAMAAPTIAQDYLGRAATSPADSAQSKTQFWASADVLSWKPHMRGLDFAVVEDGTALVLGAGDVQTIDYDRDTGFRTQIGAVFESGWGVDMSYTSFDTEGRRVVNRPGGTAQLFSTVSHPGGPEDSDVAIGTATFDYATYDLLARHSLLQSCSAGIQVFGGFRWADISQEINASFDGRDFTGGIVNHQADIKAYGLRFGGEGHWQIPWGFSVFGSTSVSALYGDFEHHRVESNFNGAQLLVDLQDDYVQPVYNFESAVGVAWYRNGWQISSGYELNIWTNIGDSLRFVDDIEEGVFTALPGDLLLEGFFIRVTRVF